MKRTRENRFAGIEEFPQDSDVNSDVDGITVTLDNCYAEPLGVPRQRAKSSNESKLEKSSRSSTMKQSKNVDPNQSEAVSVSGSTAARKRPSAKQKLPGTIQPMLAKIASEPFNADGWIFEPKLDGVRALAFVRGSNVTLLSRRNLDLTERYPGVVDALDLQKYNLILDGEITAIDRSGHPSFQLLQRAAQLRHSNAIRIIYYVFDILFADDRAVIDLPLEERRKLLRKYVNETDVVKLVGDLGSNGILAFELCVQHDLEGIIAKKLQSKYLPGQRNGDWLKVKSFKSTELIVCGYSAGTGARDDSFGSLVLGYYSEDDELTYAGSVGTGFNQKLLADLMKRMKPLIQKNSPFKKKIAGKSGITWVKPQLIAEVKFSEWTNDRILRIPVFLRLRDDMSPEQVRGQ